MSIILSNLFALNSIFHCRWVSISSFSYSEKDRYSCNVLGLFISDMVYSHMLQYANRIWIWCVNIRTIKIPLIITLVVFSKIAFVNSDFDQLLEVILEVWKRTEGSIEKFLIATVDWNLIRFVHIFNIITLILVRMDFLSIGTPLKQTLLNFPMN